MKFRDSYSDFKPWYKDTGIIIVIVFVLLCLFGEITREYLNKKYIEKYLKELRQTKK